MLNRRITVESATVARTATGGEVKTWEVVAEVWAAATWKGGKELTAARTIHPDAEVVWLIRAGAAAVTPKMRIVYNARLFDVLGVDDLSDRDRVRIVCKEGKRLGT